MSRKTVSVAELLFEVNGRNTQTHSSYDMRHGWNTLLETFLFSTGNYEGFKYLTADKVPPGEKPGVNTVDFDDSLLTYVDKFANTDDTRRFYYVSERLRSSYDLLKV